MRSVERADDAKAYTTEARDLSVIIDAQRYALWRSGYSFRGVWADFLCVISQRPSDHPIA
jgi:hypothetical protein